jgi:hypothetical protein
MNRIGYVQETNEKSLFNYKEGDTVNTCICSIITVSEFKLWKAIAGELSNEGTPNFQLEVRRVCTSD